MEHCSFGVFVTVFVPFLALLVCLPHLLPAERNEWVVFFFDPDMCRFLKKHAMNPCPSYAAIPPNLWRWLNRWPVGRFKCLLMRASHLFHETPPQPSRASLFENAMSVLVAESIPLASCVPSFLHGRQDTSTVSDGVDVVTKVQDEANEIIRMFSFDAFPRFMKVRLAFLGRHPCVGSRTIRC